MGVRRNCGIRKSHARPCCAQQAKTAFRPLQSPRAPVALQQIKNPHVANIRLAGVGIIARDGLDVVAGDAGGPLCAEALIHMVDADFA